MDNALKWIRELREKDESLSFKQRREQGDKATKEVEKILGKEIVRIDPIEVANRHSSSITVQPHQHRTEAFFEGV